MKTLQEAATALHNRGYSKVRIASIAGVTPRCLFNWMRNPPKKTDTEALKKMQSELRKAIKNEAA